MAGRPPFSSTGSRRRAAPGVVAQLEFFGPTGSHKDRVALAVVEAAERRGDIELGMTVVDYTGGSIGAALTVVCALKGYECVVVCSDAYWPEKLRSMAALGADVEVVPSRGGAVDRELVPRLIVRAAALGARPGCFYLDMHRRIWRRPRWPVSRAVCYSRKRHAPRGRYGRGWMLPSGTFEAGTARLTGPDSRGSPAS